MFSTSRQRSAKVGTGPIGAATWRRGAGHLSELEPPRGLYDGGAGSLPHHARPNDPVLATGYISDSK